MTDEPFGAKRQAVAVAHTRVPMLEPLLAASRDIVQAIGWFRAETERMNKLCTHLEHVLDEMKATGVAEEATRNVEITVRRLRDQVTSAFDFCKRLETMTSDLHEGAGEDEEFKMPRLLSAQREPQS